MLKALIVDDEPIARRVLRDELLAIPGVAVVGEAENGQQALQQIIALEPDLVFLDLQMPVMGGFEVARKLGGGQRLPVIVIVTAFDQHAIEAFEAGAIDYLLKPVSEARVRLAVQRAAALKNKPLEIANDVARVVAALPGPSPATTRKIVGRHGGEYFLLDAADILAFQAERELVWIVTAKRRLLATQTLRSVEERLQGLSFQRVHRNALVNVDHVRKITALSSQRWTITLSSGLEIVASKRQARHIRTLLHW